MAHFFGIVPGEEKIAPGLRVRVPLDGDKVYMHGKWLDLGDDHGVIFITRQVKFIRPDQRVLRLGEFPAWVCRGAEKKRPTMAAMFNVNQFLGGAIWLDGKHIVLPRAV